MSEEAEASWEEVLNEHQRNSLLSVMVLGTMSKEAESSWEEGWDELCR